MREPKQIDETKGTQFVTQVWCNDQQRVDEHIVFLQKDNSKQREPLSHAMLFGNVCKKSLFHLPTSSLSEFLNESDTFFVHLYYRKIVVFCQVYSIHNFLSSVRY